MKKIIFCVLAFLCNVSFVFAFNALEDHQKYKNELDSMSYKQLQENPKHLYYYKGPVNYTGGGHDFSSAKKIQKKKGVKFKVDSSSEKESNDQKPNESNQSSSSEKKQNSTVKTKYSQKSVTEVSSQRTQTIKKTDNIQGKADLKTGKSVTSAQTSKNHNADAE